MVSVKTKSGHKPGDIIKSYGSQEADEKVTLDPESLHLVMEKYNKNTPSQLLVIH